MDAHNSRTHASHQPKDEHAKTCKKIACRKLPVQLTWHLVIARGQAYAVMHREEDTTATNPLIGLAPLKLTKDENGMAHYQYGAFWSGANVPLGLNPSPT